MKDYKLEPDFEIEYEDIEKDNDYFDDYQDYLEDLEDQWTV